MAVTSATSSGAINNLYSSVAAKNKGLGGLVSGLDTDSLVETMLLGTRNKIGLQQQQRQTLQWKMTAYRGVADILGEFNSKYLKTDAGKTPITMNKYFQIFSGTTTNSSALTVLTSSCSKAGNVEVTEISSLAEKAKYTSDVRNYRLLGIDQADLSSMDFRGKTLTLQLNDRANTERTIDLTSLQGVTPPQFEWDLQQLIKAEFGLDPDQVSYPGFPLIYVGFDGVTNQLELYARDNKITVVGDCDELGFKAGDSNRMSTNLTLAEAFPDLVGAGANGQYVSFRVNGTLITARLDETVSKVMSRVTNTASANAKLSYNSASMKFELEATNSGVGSTLVIEDVQGNFLNQLFETQGGSSVSSAANAKNKWGYDQYVHGGTVNDTDATGYPTVVYGTFYNLAANLAAGQTGVIDLVVNGKPITLNVTVDNSPGSQYDKIINELSEQMIDKLGGSLNDPSTLSATDREVYYAAMDELFQKLILDAVNDALDDELDLDAGTVTFGVSSDGRTYFAGTSVTTNGRIPDATVSIEVVENLATLPGETNLFTNHFQYTAPADNFSAANLTTLGDLGFSIVPPAFETLTISDDLGNTYNMNYDETTTLHDIREWLWSLGRLAPPTNIDVELTVVDGVVTLAGTDSNRLYTFDDSEITGTGLLSKLFGVQPVTDPVTMVTTCSYETAAAGANHYSAGENATIKVLVDGVVQTYTNTVNSFDVNGVVFEVHELLAAADPNIIVSVVPDHTQLAENLKEFVEDYNNMLMLISNLIYEQPEGIEDGNTYAPLTDDQKSEMTEKEIEIWEEKAKKGLMHNDEYLRRIVDQLRKIMITTVESAGLAPYMIGISGVSIYNSEAKSVSYGKSGQLELDEDKLLQALELNGEAVRQMFTDSEKGIGTLLAKAIDKQINTSSARDTNGVFISRGTLIQLAGTPESTGYNSSFLQERIESVDRQISILKSRLEREYTRYWKKFSTLETTLARLSAQSSWLTEQTS